MSNFMTLSRLGASLHHLEARYYMQGAVGSACLLSVMLFGSRESRWVVWRQPLRHCYGAPECG